MKKKPTDQLVYETLYPRPKPGDPQDFKTFLTRHLVYEVRQEVHAYYGHIDDLESKYPGLDYCHKIHRMRLSRWQWHRRLFRAFDTLGLTDSEIQGLTQWEGTRWAKERYEQDQGIFIRDTTADCMSDFVPPEDRPSRDLPLPTTVIDDKTAEHEGDMAGGDASYNTPEAEEDEVRTVVGGARIDMRNRLAPWQAFDEDELEQWLKNEIEEREAALRRSGRATRAPSSYHTTAAPPDPRSGPSRLARPPGRPAAPYHSSSNPLSDVIGAFEDLMRVNNERLALARAIHSGTRVDTLPSTSVREDSELRREQDLRRLRSPTQPPTRDEINVILRETRAAARRGQAAAAAARSGPTAW